MSAEGSVTGWIDRLKAGDRAAAGPVWERYFHRLVGLARQRLAGARKGAADEEDVALSAFNSFFLAAESGRFPRLDDRDDLWRLLVVMTERKAADLARAQRRLKRGGGKVVGESALVSSDADAPAGFGLLPGDEPSPAFAALVAEECGRLLDRLGDEQLRRLALLKMDGHSNEEIAAELGCALRTVERKLGLIRDLWSAEGGGPEL